MNTVCRREGATASVAAALIAVVAVVLGVGAPARAQTSTPGATGTALGKVEQCVKQRKSLLVMLLVDESASLKQTDPDAQRVVGSQVAVKGLRHLAASSNSNVEIQVAGFANDFDSLTPWTRLSDQSDAAIDGAIAAFSDRNEGLDTDYAHALQGAQQSLAARSAQVTANGGDPPCKLLLWFTDGEYSIDSRDEKEYAPDASGPNRSQQIIDAGRDLICRPNGLADALHQSDISVLALALSSGESPIAPADVDFLQSVAAGRGGNQSCGTLGSDTTGASITAGDLTQLLDLFDRFAAIGGTPVGPAENQVICQRQSCPEGRRTFEIEEWMERFHLFAQTGLSGIVVQVEAPGVAQPATIPANGEGAVDIGSSVLRYSWVNPKVLVVDGAPENGTTNWAGEWAVTFIDPTGENPNSVARSQIYLFGGLVPDVPPKSVFRQGERNVLPVALVDEKGVPVSVPSLPSISTLQATLTDPSTGTTQNLEVLPPTDGSSGYRVVYDTPADYESASAHLGLTLALKTKAGLELDATSRQFDIPVKPPIEYPEILPSKLQFPSVSGTGSTKATVTFKANRTDGCVWIMGGGSSFPDRPGSIDHVDVSATPGATSEKSCLQVSAGSTKTVELEVHPSSSADGSVQGQIKIGLTSKGESKAITKSIPASFDVTRPVDSDTRWVLVALLMVLGVGGPLVWLWFSARREARFQPTDQTRMAQVPVRVTSSSVTRLVESESDGSALLIDELADIKPFEVPTPERLRRFDLQSMPNVTLRALPPRSPFGLPKAQASSPGLVCSSGESRVLGLSDPDAAEISLALAGSWVFVATNAVARGDDGEATEIDGTLIAFFSPGNRVAQVERTRAAVRTRLPLAFPRLRRAFPPEPVAVPVPAAGPGWTTAESGSEPTVDDETPPWARGATAGTNASDAAPFGTGAATRGTSTAEVPATAPDEASLPTPTEPPADDDPPWANS